MNKAKSLTSDSFIFYESGFDLMSTINLPSFSICTLGCKVNQYESQSIADEFEKHGFILKAFDEACDIYIINSCTVTSQSDKKSRQMLRKALKTNENAIIALCGCFSQVQGDKLKYLTADLIIGNKDKFLLAEKIMELYNKKIKGVYLKSSAPLINTDVCMEEEYKEIKIQDSERARAYIKIQDGCNSKCSYCIIPKARGKSRSRIFENIKDEIIRFDEKRFHEIVLTGIEISSYGEDFIQKNIKLIDLFEKIDSIPFKNIKNIRIGSLDPLIINKNFIDRYKTLKHFTPHFHLSVQSASDEILKKMRRKYNKKTLYDNINYAYESIKDLILTADIIVGFPGESDDDFNETLKFIEDKKIYHTHIFPYSARTGTEASAFPYQINEHIKKDRVKQAEKLSLKIKADTLKDNLNKEMYIICEDLDEENYVNAKTANYMDIKVDLSDFEEKENICKHGEIKKVITYKYDGLYLYSKLI